MVFDTHEAVKRLKSVGFNDAQAEMQTRIIVELVNDQLATKRDLEELKNDLTIRLGGMLVAGIGAIATLLKWIGH
ncbi:MAG: DUF1640 domain-containing protein [Magnetococcales bacterium]|nr:DUF1640 domain-containing protein [Magnetococcales bacterium]